MLESVLSKPHVTKIEFVRKKKPQGKYTVSVNRKGTLPFTDTVHFGNDLTEIMERITDDEQTIKLYMKPEPMGSMEQHLEEMQRYDDLNDR